MFSTLGHRHNHVKQIDSLLLWICLVIGHLNPCTGLSKLEFLLTISSFPVTLLLENYEVHLLNPLIPRSD